VALGGEVFGVDRVNVIPSVSRSQNGLAVGASGISAWASVRIDPSPVPGVPPGLVGGGPRADMPAEGGDDILVGGVGDDLLVGGAGQDLLVGSFAANRPANTGQDTGLAALDALMARRWSG
jgi:Ca2+-binding RTX toxin-like protein